MQKKIWALFGRTVYAVGSYVALPFFLNGSRRTRVAIINKTNSKVLLSKTFISNQKWSLIGGGAKKGEKTIDCALREVKEETGLELRAKDVTFVKEQVQTEKNASYTAFYYIAELSNPQPKRGGAYREILDLEWFKLRHLPENTDKDSKAFIAELISSAKKPKTSE